MSGGSVFSEWVMKADETQTAELWRRTLAQIPSMFGRLVYVASLRDLNTGSYQHFGLAQKVGDKEADRTLRRSHLNTFADWLCFSLEEQKDQLELYFRDADGDPTKIILNWLEFPPFLNWVPSRAADQQRSLFCLDLGIVMERIRRERAVASPVQNASRHR